MLELISAIALLCAGPNRSNKDIFDCQKTYLKCALDGKSRYRDDNLRDCILNGEAKK